MDNPVHFKGKSVVELGAGLGLVAVLIDKLEYCNDGGLLVATDGDEPTIQLLIENKVDNEGFFDASYLYWGETEDFLSNYPDKFQVVVAADVIYADEHVIPLIDTVCAVMQGTNYI
jgi:predicted nicotinamide N-methyase